MDFHTYKYNKIQIVVKAAKVVDTGTTLRNQNNFKYFNIFMEITILS